MPNHSWYKHLVATLTLLAVLAIPALRAPCYLSAAASQATVSCCAATDDTASHPTGCCQEPAPAPEWALLVVDLPTGRLPVLGTFLQGRAPLQAELDLRAGREGLGRRLLPRAPPLLG